MTNTVTQQQIDALLDNAKTEEHLFHGGKSWIISYQLENGWTVDGRAAIVDPAGFDIEIGRRVARQNAASQLWALEGYLLQNKLADIAKEVEKMISNEKMTDKLAFEGELYTKVNLATGNSEMVKLQDLREFLEVNKNLVTENNICVRVLWN